MTEDRAGRPTYKGPEVRSYETVLQEHDEKLRTLSEQIEGAGNVIDLRQAWTDYPLTDSFAAYVSDSAHEHFLEALNQGLSRLGLDLSSEDERIAQIVAAMAESTRVHGNYTHGSFDPVMTGLYRIISAGDPSRERGLELQAPRQLVPAVISDTKKAALSFTGEKEYAIVSRFPRKAFRWVRDPHSRFWGFEVHTDTWPDPNNNISISMPASLTTQSEIIRTEPRGKDYIQTQLTPRNIGVQGIQLGTVNSRSRQVDTNDGLVTQFIQQIGSSQAA